MKSLGVSWSHLEANLTSDYLSTITPLHKIINKNKLNNAIFIFRYGRYNTCRQLLDTPGFKRILNEPDQAGQTPLHLCCQNGHTRVVQLLLHKGAQFTKCFNGNTPLHEAAANGHTSTMNTILQAHAHLINSVNRFGMTPLHCAALAGHVECVDLLLSKSAQFLTNTDGETFFDLAIMKKQKHVCLTIIAHDR